MGIENLVMYCRAPPRKEDLPSLAKRPEGPFAQGGCSRLCGLPPPRSPPGEDRPQAELPLPDYNHPDKDTPRSRYDKGRGVRVVDMDGDDELVPDANDDGPNVFSMC